MKSHKFSSTDASNVTNESLSLGRTVLLLFLIIVTGILPGIIIRSRYLKNRKRTAAVVIEDNSQSPETGFVLVRPAPVPTFVSGTLARAQTSLVASPPSLPTLVFADSHIDKLPKESLEEKLEALKDLGYHTLYLENIPSHVSGQQAIKHILENSNLKSLARIEALMKECGETTFEAIHTTDNAVDFFNMLQKNMHAFGYKFLFGSKEDLTLEVKNKIACMQILLKDFGSSNEKAIFALLTYPEGKSLIKMISKALELGMNVEGIEEEVLHKAVASHAFNKAVNPESLDVASSTITAQENFDKRDNGFANKLLKEHQSNHPAMFLVGAEHATTIFDCFKKSGLENKILFDFTFGPRTLSIEKIRNKLKTMIDKIPNAFHCITPESAIPNSEAFLNQVRLHAHPESKTRLTF